MRLQLAAQHPRNLTGVELDADEVITARLLRPGEFHDGAGKQEPLIILAISGSGSRNRHAVGVVDRRSWRAKRDVDVSRNRSQRVG